MKKKRWLIIMLSVTVLIVMLILIGSLHTQKEDKRHFQPVTFPRDAGSHIFTAPEEIWYFGGKIVTQKHQIYNVYLLFCQAAIHVFGFRWIIPLVQLKLVNLKTGQHYFAAHYFVFAKPKFSHKKLSIDLGKWGRLVATNNSQVADLSINLVTKNGIRLKLNGTLYSKTPPLLINHRGDLRLNHGVHIDYYIQPSITFFGSMVIGRVRKIIDAKKSELWLEHNWTNLPLNRFTHWFWLGLRLNSGARILVFKIQSFRSVKQIINVLDKNHHWLDYSKSKLSIMPIYTPDNHSGYVQAFAIKAKGQHFSLNVKIKSLSSYQHTPWLWDGLSTLTGTMNGQPIHGYSSFDLFHEFEYRQGSLY